MNTTPPAHEMCAIHDRHEPSLPGDYKICGECLHVWRTEDHFVLDVLTDYAAHVVSTLKYDGIQLGPYEGDPRDHATCPLCSHSF